MSVGTNCCRFYSKRFFEFCDRNRSRDLICIRHHVNMTRFTNLLVCHSLRLLGLKLQKIDHPLTFWEQKSTTIYLYPERTGIITIIILFIFYTSRGYGLPKITIGAKKNGQTLSYIEYLYIQLSVGNTLTHKHTQI